MIRPYFFGKLQQLLDQRWVLMRTEHNKWQLVGPSGSTENDDLELAIQEAVQLTQGSGI